MQADPAPRRLESIQVLRGLAASAVLVSHIGLEIQRHSTALSAAAVDALDTGRAGVDVFFVISGFVMAYVASAHFGSAAESKRFMVKRLARIVPVYWFYTTLMLAVILLSPSLLRHSVVTVPYTLASYLFFPFPQPDSGQMRPLLELGWTLNYEMYFYALFALAILFSRRAGFILLSTFIVAAVLAGAFIDRPLSVQYWTRPILLEFLAGVGVGLIFLNGIRIPRTAAYAVGAVGLIWFVLLARSGNEATRVIVLGVPALLFVAAATLERREGPQTAPGLTWRFLLLLGDASYSLYLTHMFVVRAVTAVIHAGTFGPFYLPVYCGVVMVTAALVAIVSYRVIEVPSKTVLERWLVSRSPAPERGHCDLLTPHLEGRPSETSG
jgi:peptidoglycan/LPS O-acetylase OafA/YrhL